MRGILPVIPPRSNCKLPEHPDYRRYEDRNRVERMFGKPKQQGRIATRYDKTVLSFKSFLNPAAVQIWLKSFVVDKLQHGGQPQHLENFSQDFLDILGFLRLCFAPTAIDRQFPREQRFDRV